MNYNKLEEIVSKPRLKRYKIACNGEKRKAVKLYQLNVVLSQSLYPHLSMFEVTLRNAIDKEMRLYFNNASWLVTENLSGGFSTILANNGDSYMHQTVNQIFSRYDDRATHLNIISEVSLGFWTRFFKRNYFRILRGRPIQIFQNATTPVQRAGIYVILQRIRNLRNRIYHNEPICFSHSIINTAKTAQTIDELLKLSNWIEPEAANTINPTQDAHQIIQQINSLAIT